MHDSMHAITHQPLAPEPTSHEQLGRLDLADGLSFRDCRGEWHVLDPREQIVPC